MQLYDMNLISTVFVLMVASAASKSTCSSNNVCIRLEECPKYYRYAEESFEHWPPDVQANVTRAMCDYEQTDKATIRYVCCPTALNSRRCGVQSNNRISHGTVAQAFDFPWMALLKDVRGSFVCGGTLVTARFVLTAAHCLKSARITSVRVGDIDLSKDPDCITLDNETECAEPYQEIEVLKQISHPFHSGRYRKHDIALLKLKEPAVLNDSVNPICVPQGTSPRYRSIDVPFLIVSGWGLTEQGQQFDVLRYARVPPVPLDQCVEQLRSRIGYLKIGEGQACAGGADKVDNCRGDSGGPLQYIDEMGRWVQHGVVQYGLDSCGLESKPGVYTSVLHYLGWIVKHVDE